MRGHARTPLATDKFSRLARHRRIRRSLTRPRRPIRQNWKWRLHGTFL